jgi:hypothetical protein
MPKPAPFKMLVDGADKNQFKSSYALNDSTALSPGLSNKKGFGKASTMTLNSNKSQMNISGKTPRIPSGRRKSRAEISTESALKEATAKAAASRLQVTARMRKSGQKDWNNLKRDIIASLTFRMTATFIKLLQSKELDKLLVLAVDYGKWYVHVYLLQKQQEQSSSSRLRELPEHLVSIFLPAAITSVENETLEDLTIEGVTSLEQARKKSKMILKEFGRAYCFLLLYAAEYRQESSKERLHFEQIYKVCLFNP